jgi:hypothetical protein
MVEPTAKELVDACMKQSDHGYQSWNDRRQYEWKLTVAFWSATVLSVGFFARDVRLYWAWFIIAAVVAYWVFMRWLYGLWKANQFDRQVLFHYREQARLLLVGQHSILNFPYSKPDDPDFVRQYLGFHRFLKDWAMSSYSLITALLLIAAFPFARGQVSSKADDRLKSVEERLRAIEELSNRTANSVASGLSRLDRLESDLKLLVESPRQNEGAAKRKGR